jgi:hypothetical protein
MPGCAAWPWDAQLRVARAELALARPTTILALGVNHLRFFRLLEVGLSERNGRTGPEEPKT